MQYKNNKKEKSIFAKTIEESKNEISIDWAIRNSKSVVNDVIESKPELKSNINELKAIKRYNRGFIDRNTLTNDYVDYSAKLLRLFYKTYKAIKIVGNTQYHAASQYFCQVGEIQWLSYKNGPNMCIGGTAIAESNYNETTHSKDNAFDNNNTSNCWSCNTKTTGTETWICYIKTTATPVYCIRIYPREGYANLNFKNFRILASNNTTNGIDGTWDTLLTNQNTYYVNNWSEHYITNQTLNNSIIVKGGNTVTKITDNGINYAVHTFTSSGNFEVLNGSGEVEYFIVAGGGGGAHGVYASGSGGAGGYTKYDCTVINNKIIYTIIVGAGGAGGNNSNGLSGGISSFYNIISDGGGGANRLGYKGGNGGSGGGGGGGSGTIAGNGGSDGSDGGPGRYTPGKGQGTTTKNPMTNILYSGGGGGGGSGYSSGSNPGNGGNGGGASGCVSGSIYHGLANTGGGGGGGYGTSDGTGKKGGNGGSGIVIIRYRIP